MKQDFGKKGRPLEGDLVQNILSFKPDSRGKWAPNYEGLYAMTLAIMDGDKLHYNIFILRQRQKTVADIVKTVLVGYQNGFLGVANRGVVLSFQNAFFPQTATS